MNELTQIFNFIRQVEPLKDTLRSSYTKNGKQESVAEHSWRLALMAIVICPKYFPEVKLDRVITMCLIHDLGEIINGDIPAPEQSNHPNKSEEERKDFQQVIQSLPIEIGIRFLESWDEYENATSKEAKLVKALDKLETIIQHNQGSNPDGFDHQFDLTYGTRYMDFDPVIEKIRSLVDNETQTLI